MSEFLDSGSSSSDLAAAFSSPPVGDAATSIFGSGSDAGRSRAPRWSVTALDFDVNDDTGILGSLNELEITSPDQQRDSFAGVLNIHSSGPRKSLAAFMFDRDSITDADDILGRDSMFDDGGINRLDFASLGGDEGRNHVASSSTDLGGSNTTTSAQSQASNRQSHIDHSVPDSTEGETNRLSMSDNRSRVVKWSDEPTEGNKDEVVEHKHNDGGDRVSGDRVESGENVASATEGENEGPEDAAGEGAEGEEEGADEEGENVDELDESAYAEPLSAADMEEFVEDRPEAPTGSVSPEALASLKAIEEELQVIMSAANAGLPYDESRLDFLLQEREDNDAFQHNQAVEYAKWREEIEDYTFECLLTMRSFVPPNIFSATSDALLADGLDPEIAKRILQRHCLWMVRMGKTDIARLHDVDLSNRYNTSAQLLDVVELAAIMASLPERFSNDPMGKKMAWKTQLENQLKQAMADRDAGTLPKNKLRAPVYTTAKGPYTDLSTVREIDAVVKADVVNRKSFTEVCGAHSILAKKKKRPKSVVVDSAAHAKLLSDMSMQDAMNSRGSM